MRVFVRSTTLVFLLACLPLCAPGQESQREVLPQGERMDSLRRANTASVLLDRNLNTLNWSGRMSIDTMFSRTRITASGQFLANIIQPDGGTAGGLHSSESTQDDISLGIRHPIADFVSIDTRWSSLVFADNRGTGLSNASSHTGLAGISFFPVDFLSLTPLGGYRWDTQAGVRDRGISYGLEAELAPIDFDGYRFSGIGRMRRDAINPRVLDNHLAEISVYKPFGTFSRDSLEVGFLQTRREFYSREDSAIESRTDRYFSLANLLAFDVGQDLMTTMFVSISSRLLDKDERALISAAYSPSSFNTAIEEFRFDTYLQAAYSAHKRGLSALVRLGYSERSESHRAKAPEQMAQNIAVLFSERNRQEQTKDNLARRVSLSGSASLPLFDATDFYLLGSTGILRYDTPSELNYEDRDELLIAASLGLRHRFSQNLEALVSLDGTLSHLVYLLKERSANNNINRILRLSPRTIWHPVRWFSTTNVFEVLANYTVYDFEKQAALVRSFSYRQFAWLDSTRIEFSERVGLDFFTYLKLYERGLLKWEEFLERTENSSVDRTLAVQLRFTPGASTLFAIGLRYFSQSRYMYQDAVKKPDTFTGSVGPTCAIRWMIGPHSRLIFQGWYERRRLSDETFRSLATMTMHLYFHF
jgi:hypothetical protein